MCNTRMKWVQVEVNTWCITHMCITLTKCVQVDMSSNSSNLMSVLHLWENYTCECITHMSVWNTYDVTHISYVFHHVCQIHQIWWAYYTYEWMKHIYDYTHECMKYTYECITHIHDMSTCTHQIGVWHKCVILMGVLHICVIKCVQVDTSWGYYRVATISRLLKVIRLFYERAL